MPKLHDKIEYFFLSLLAMLGLILGFHLTISINELCSIKIFQIDTVSIFSTTVPSYKLVLRLEAFLQPDE